MVERQCAGMRLEALSPAPSGRQPDSSRLGGMMTTKQGSLAAAMPIRSAPGSLVIFSLTILCLGLTYSWGQQPGTPVVPPSLPLLTRAGDIRALSAKQANLGYPVRLRAVVTYYGNATGWELFVQDLTGGIYVQPPEEDLDLSVGQLIEVEGVTSSGGFANQIEKPTIHALGHAPLPAPQRPRYEQLALG